jgi:myo-inositol 2-dehydrogenase/D-chiro-inositol 1-dehydrogenase/scyllo-inositol 2-dehydrogenase (NAD+)
MKSEKIGVCVIGSGRAGMIHARNFAADCVPGARLVALADPAPEALGAGLKELSIDQGYGEWREALADRDVGAVVITTPTAFHREIAVAAAQAGKHILCEKPMAMNAAECEAMIAAADSGRVVLQIGFMRRHDAAFVEARRLLDSGVIGRLVQIKSITHGPSIPKFWMYDLEKSNGPLAEVNSHDIDTLRWFTGSEFETVYAMGDNYRCRDAKAEFPDFYDNVLLVARFANGMQGMIGGAQGVRYGYDARCELLGEKGLITVGCIGTTTTATYTAEGGSTRIEKSWMSLFETAYLAEDCDFAQCIRTGRAPRAGGRDGLMAVRVVNAGNRSIAERRPVEMKDVM